MYIVSGVMILFFVLLYITKQEHYKKIILFFSISIGIVSFFIILPNGVDLWRHYDSLDIMRNMNLKEMIQFEGMFVEDGEPGKYSNLYTYKLYFYFISKMNKNGFLPAITMFLIYLVTLLNIHRCACKYNIEKKYELSAIIYFVAVFNYYNAASGIRNFLAFAIVAWFLYTDLVEKKHRPLCIAMYIIMAMLHTSVIIIITIRMFIIVKNKYIKGAIIIGIACWSIFTPQIISITDRLGNSIDFFATISSQIKGNTGDDQGVIMNIGRAMFFVLLYLCIIIINKNRLQKYSADFYKYCLYAAIFMISSFRSSILFLRLNGFLLFVMPFIFMWIFKKNHQSDLQMNNDYKMQRINNYLFMIVNCVGAVYFLFNTFVFYKYVTF